VVGDWGEVVTR